MWTATNSDGFKEGANNACPSLGPFFFIFMQFLANKPSGHWLVFLIVDD